MFEAFTFAASRSPSLDSASTTTPSFTHSRSVSPCSSISPWTSPRYSVTDLAVDFNRQKLRQDSQIYSQPCQAYANFEDDAGWTLEEQERADLPLALASRTQTARSYSPVRRRVDRQVQSRLLCSAAHHRDIAALVSRMVRSEDQCMVQPPTSVCYTTSPICEGECETEDLSPLSRASSGYSVASRRDIARRTSDLHKTGASISKDSRRRKDKPRRQKSSDE